MRPDIVIDTSWNEGLLAMVRDGEVVQEARFLTGRDSDSALFQSTLAQMLREYGKPGRVIVGLGPGNHSSVRVGIATAIGLSIGLNIPAHGVPSPYGIDTETKAFTAIGKAGREEFWSFQVKAAMDSRGAEILDVRQVEALISSDVKLFTVDITLDSLAEAARLSAIKFSQSASNQDGLRPLEPIYLKPANITRAKVIPQVQWQKMVDQR